MLVFLFRITRIVNASCLSRLCRSLRTEFETCTVIYTQAKGLYRFVCVLVARVSGISIGISGLLIVTSQELMDLYSETDIISEIGKGILRPLGQLERVPQEKL